MPRGSKKNANQHNSRHENGVVAPGKRIVKQKSNGNLNGSPDRHASTSSPPAATPAKTLSPLPRARANGSASPGPASSHALRREGSKGGHREESAEELLQQDQDQQQQQSGADGPDGSDGMHDSHAARRPDGHIARAYSAAAASLPIPLTVLLSCPLRDALAILILLLSLPPVLVTVTNSLFAVMTFVPPSGSFTLVPTLTDITSSFSPGTPSFLVTCLIDVVAMTLWIWIPFPALQAFFLDAAQAMVATTLGGGHSYRPGSKDNTLYCVSIVVASHLARYRAVFLRPIRHRIEKWGPLIGEFDDRYIEKYPVAFERNWLATIKVFIALHIFCQGVTGMVRRRLHTPRQTSTSSTSVRVAEADQSAAYSTGADVPPNPPHSPTELRPRQSFPNLREANRDKISSGKRRRKQANYVRSQQPFWAAIAATKTNIMREYETNRATADAANAKATGAKDLGDAPFQNGESVVWVTEVKEMSFFFETGPLPTPRSYREPVQGDEDDEGSKEEGVDRTKPLYVRCNKTDWVSMRLVSVPDSGVEHRHRWAGEVYGLSAGKTYQISFVRSEDNEVVSTQTVATPAATIDVATAMPSTVAFSPARPSSPASPTATLKSSIADSEARVADLEAQQRRARKDNKASIQNLHREIEVFNERLQNNSSNDTNLQARLGQLTQHKRQVDDAVEAINTELDDFEVLPAEEYKEWKIRKATVDSRRKKQTTAHNELANHRKNDKQALDARKSEEINVGHKIVRLQGRLKRVSEQHAKLTTVPEDETVARSNDQARSGSDSSGNNQPGRKFDTARYQKEIDMLNRELQMRTIQNNTLIPQVRILEESMRLAEQHSAGFSQVSDEATAFNPYFGASSLSPRDESRPTTPDNDFSGAFPVPGGIGTGFGGARYEHSGTPESNGGLAAPAYPPDTNGSSQHHHHHHHHHHANQFSSFGGSFGGSYGGYGDGPSLHYGAGGHLDGRMRASSGLSGDSLQFFHPDDDELVPDKVKRRSGFGRRGTSIGSIRDGSDGSSGSSGASPAIRYRGMGMRASPSPRH